jgi:hypothetical protein
MNNPKDFRQAYLETVYSAAGVRFCFSSTPTQEVLFGGRTFGIITAHNPRSERLSDEENAKRHQDLAGWTAALGWQFASSLGSDLAGLWQEEGIVLWDAELSVALELARHYQQHAIVFGEKGKVALVWCETGEAEWGWANTLK